MRYIVDPEGTILYLEGATDQDRREAEAEQARILGDQMPRIVADADLTLDEQAGSIRVGGLELRYPGFADLLLPPKVDIGRSTSLARDLPVLHFMELYPTDTAATAEVGDLVGFKLGVAVLKQTTMVTDPDIRTRRVQQLRDIQQLDLAMFSGSVGDFREGVQCWVDVCRDSSSTSQLVASIISFAGPEIASSTMVVFDIYGAFTYSSSRAFVRSMIEQGCGEVPAGFDDGQ